MKKLMGSLLMVASAWSMSASANNAQVNADVLAKTVSSVMVQAQNALNMINWQVGDYHKFNVKFLFGGGSGLKSVPSEDVAQNAVWLKNEMTLMGQKQVTETLLSRTDAKVLKLIVNGKEQDPNAGGDAEIEILEQYEDNVTVPAGTFKAMYVKLKTKAEGQETVIQVWVNPIDVGLDGQIKLVAETQFGPLTLEVTEFKK